MRRWRLRALIGVVSLVLLFRKVDTLLVIGGAAVVSLVTALAGLPG